MHKIGALHGSLRQATPGRYSGWELQGEVQFSLGAPEKIQNVQSSNHSQYAPVQ